MPVGSSALLRHVYRGRVGWAIPVNVVEDTDDQVVLLRHAGTRIKAPVRSSTDDLMQKLAADEYEVGDSEWSGTNVLEVLRPERWHSVWPMWAAGSWDFLCWYVNFQEPVRRSLVGWDTFDLALDMVVYPDGNWRWKDQDHFAVLEDLGVIPAASAAAVRADAERVIADIEAGAYPFDQDWTTWRPDPSWAKPTLPDGWDVL